MLTATALATLLDHQNRVLTLARQADALLRRGTPADAGELARLRWEMSRLLRAYQLFKHGEILDPVVARARPGEAQAAAQMKRRCLALGEAWREHVLRWTARGPAEHWDEYRAAAQAMVASLCEHLARERREIAQLLDAGPGRTRLRQPGSAARR